MIIGGRVRAERDIHPVIAIASTIARRGRARAPMTLAGGRSRSGTRRTITGTEGGNVDLRGKTLHVADRVEVGQGNILVELDAHVGLHLGILDELANVDSHVTFHRAVLGALELVKSGLMDETLILSD